MRLYKSVENVIFDGVDLADRFSRGNGYFIVNDVRGRAYRPTSVDMRTVPNKAGGFAGPLRTGPRTIEIDYTLKSDTYEELRKLLEEFNALVLKDSTVPLRFADEPDRTYYGKVSGIQNTLERSRIHKGTITVVCEDPYKYGMQKTVNGLSVQNNGTVETPFTIEMEVAQPSTHLTVTDGKSLLTIGKPLTSGQYTESLKFHDPLDSTAGWTPIGALFTDYTESGQIVSAVGSGTYSRYFWLSNVTTEGQWTGRSIVKSVGTTANYRVEGIFEVINNEGLFGTFREYLMIVDATGKEVGRLGIISGGDNNVNRLEVRIGNEASNYKLIDSSALIYGSLVNAFCKIVLEKKGNVFRASVITVDKSTGVEINEEITAFYVDVFNQYPTPLSAVAIHMAQQKVHTYRIYDVKIYEIVDAASTNPNVVSVGDKILIDTGKRQVLINGVLRNAYKNLNSDFFQVSPGKTNIIVNPAVSINQKVTFRERYL